MSHCFISPVIYFAVDIFVTFCQRPEVTLTFFIYRFLFIYTFILYLALYLYLVSPFLKHIFCSILATPPPNILPSCSVIRLGLSPNSHISLLPTLLRSRYSLISPWQVDYLIIYMFKLWVDILASL